MGREAKGLSKGRYDETFAGEDAKVTISLKQSVPRVLKLASNIQNQRSDCVSIKGIA